MSKRGKRKSKGSRHDKQHFLLIDGEKVVLNKKQRRYVKYKMFSEKDPILNKLFAEEVENTATEDITEEDLQPIDLASEFASIDKIYLMSGFQQIYEGDDDPFPLDTPPWRGSEDENPRALSSKQLSDGDNIYSTLDNRTEEDMERIRANWGETRY